MIYGVQANDVLAWMRHLSWHDGRPVWANNGDARVIGTGWLQYRWVLAAGGGQVFGVDADGTVTWHRYELGDALTGEGKWHQTSGSIIAKKLGRYERYFGGWDGVIYGVGADRSLWWHRYLGNDGSTGLQAWSRAARPFHIGHVLSEGSIAGPGGAIYDIKDGHLLRRQYVYDQPGWVHGGQPHDLGDGWADERWAMVAEDGIVYSVDNARGSVPVRADQLRWRRHGDPAASDAAWTGADRRIVVAQNMTIEPLAALQGYATRLSAAPGEELGLAVSTGHTEYSLSILKLTATKGMETISSEVRLPGRLQRLPTDYREGGCGWSEDFRAPIGDDWPSGLYAARLKALGGWQFDIPFAVRPGAYKAPIAYLWPTNTYNAYNDWGGHNQYTPGQHGKQRTCSFLRPSVFNNVDGAADRRITGDLLLLRWLAEEGVPFDCYHDGDLHLSGEWLMDYRALILAMHPEYWSEAMRSNLEAYLARGGSLIYVGGNGIYERVEFNDPGTALTFRRPDGERDLYRAIGAPEHEILGIGYVAASHGTQAPYKVIRDHPLFAGTGLRPGDLFGARGVLGAASGWEVDRRETFSSVTDDQVIAEGLNEGGGAEMVFRPHEGGGWTFSAGSITFTGAIRTDATVRRLLRNVVEIMVK